MPWYKQLHWQIIIGLVLGLIFGIVAAGAGLSEFVQDWIGPFGVIFINALKLIAVPLVLASLIVGVASLSDLSKLSRIGGKTIGIYLATTTVALVIGLTLVNLIEPGATVPEETSRALQERYADATAERVDAAAAAQDRGPLQPLIDMVPDNFFLSASDNRNMLQVVFVALFMGIGLLLIPREKGAPLLAFFDSLNDLVIKLVHLIMLAAPVGVFALMADTIASLAGDDPGEIIGLLQALVWYCAVVVIGLVIHMSLTYGSMVKLLTPHSIKSFLSGIAPAQLLAFSTSSSGATLPVTMECAEENLGVSEEVSSFVLPLGATINMDGTGLYQAVAAVFIAQALGMGLDLGAQLAIVLTALLASIGTAAVPSAGIVMLVVILESVQVPAAGIALILGVDRPLDMLRTVTNVTGDATVATVVATSEGQIQIPAKPVFAA
jgi:Na+/H+-dicarboxylate symporter